MPLNSDQSEKFQVGVIEEFRLARLRQRVTNRPRMKEMETLVHQDDPMSIIRPNRNRSSRNGTGGTKRNLVASIFASVALASASGLGWIVAGTLLPGGQIAVASEFRVQFRMCGSGQRYTCVVDGDTIWLNGQNLRLQATGSTR